MQHSPPAGNEDLYLSPITGNETNGPIPAIRAVVVSASPWCRTAPEPVDIHQPDRHLSFSSSWKGAMPDAIDTTAILTTIDLLADLAADVQAVRGWLAR